MRVNRLFFLLCFVLVSWFCSSQVNTIYLDTPVPEDWAIGDTLFQQISPVEDMWWTKFNDPTLDTLIALATTQNYSALMAVNKIQIARANWRSAQGSFYPSLSLNIEWAREQESGTVSAAPQSASNELTANITMSWEIDVFGRIRRNVKSQKESYEAAQADYDAILVSLCGEVASTYFMLRQYQKLYVVTNRNCEFQWEVVEITKTRFATGLSSKLDVAQALSSYYSSKSSLYPIESSIVQYENTLSLLLGIYPDSLRQVVGAFKGLPEYVTPIGIGIPANLLLRRPDLRESEHQIASQAALFGVSRSAWWPRIFFNGSFGFGSRDLSHLFNNKSVIYEITPSLSWTLFNGLKRLQATREARAELEVAINQYNYDVLNAVQEVDKAINSYKYAVQRIVALREVVIQGEQTLDLSLDQYKQGLIPFLNVLDAQRSLLTYESQLTQAQGNALVSLVQLYEALGGGWP